MADIETPAPPPAAPRVGTAPAPRSVPPRRVPVNVATGASPQAGHAITAQPRPPALPPGIPQGLAGHINTTGHPSDPTQAATAPEVPAPDRHAMFAPRTPARVALDRQVHQLRQQLVNAVAVGEGTIATITASIDALKDAPEAFLAAEGIDLERLVKFRAAIQGALDIAKA